MNLKEELLCPKVIVLFTVSEDIDIRIKLPGDMGIKEGKMIQSLSIVESVRDIMTGWQEKLKLTG